MVDDVADDVAWDGGEPEPSKGATAPDPEGNCDAQDAATAAASTVSLPDDACAQPPRDCVTKVASLYILSLGTKVPLFFLVRIKTT